MSQASPALRRHRPLRVVLLGVAVLAAAFGMIWLASLGSGGTGARASGTAVPVAAPEPEPVAPAPATGATAPPSPARPDASGDEDPKHLEALGRGLLPSFVRVAVWLRYDQDAPPTSLAYHEDDLASRAKDGRPVWLTGFLLAPDQVLTEDPQIAARFIARITVSQGAADVPARISAWASDVAGLLLTLEQALPRGAPLTFREAAAAPLFGVSHAFNDGTWDTHVSPVATVVHIREGGAAYSRTVAPAVVVDAQGTPVGITLNGWLPTNGAWKGSPLSWSRLAAADHAALLERAKARAAAGLLHVDVRLRGLTVAGEDRRGRRYRWSEDDGADQAERAALALLVSSRRLLVLDRMDAKTTARIESIVVHAAQGPRVPARFVASFRDFGAYLVEVDSEVGEALDLSSKPVILAHDELLAAAHVELLGGRRVIHGGSCRLDRFETGRRGEVVPDMRGPPDGEFLFDEASTLVAFPVLRRARDGEDEDWRFEDPKLLGADHLLHLLAAPHRHADPANVPVPVEREGRLAWLGVEVQRLNRELAQANQVSHLTRDGQTGALVSYVYAGSPAQKAGLEQGMVLLRYDVPGHPHPVAVLPALDRFDSRDEDEDGNDELSEYRRRQRESQAGYTPWPSAENALNRTLTALGLGTPATLEYAVAGELRRAPLTVAEGPLHHEAAARHKSDHLGLTVRDLTYEVRRHFRLDAQAPGAIVSKVEAGGHAAVAGLRRFDLVLQVNEQPVADGAACARALGAAGELRLTVRDALQQRVVKIAPAAR